MGKKTTIFVYGTLRKHEKNHELLRNAECLAKQCWTYGLLYDTGLGYPAMVADSHGRVYGELYQVTEEELLAIDRLEGYEEGTRDNLYERVRKEIYTDQGTEEAYVYIGGDSNPRSRTLTYGDWRCRNLAENKELLYFAYGSCMDDERFQLHGVGSLFQEIVGRGILKGYRLQYTHHSSTDGMGRADLVEIGGQAEGKVYQIPAEAVQYLFRREGVHSKTYRPALIDLEIEGEQVTNVLTFFVISKKEEIPPPEHYAREILRGGQGYLSEDYLKKVRRDLKEKFNMVVDEGKSFFDHV